MGRALYFLRRAFDAMVRGPFVTFVAVATIFVACLVAGLFAAGMFGAQKLLEAWARDARISVYLKAGSDLVAAEAEARVLAPGLAIEAITSKEAVARLRASLGEKGSMLDGLALDVLPASIEVKISGRPLAEVRVIAAKLMTMRSAVEVDFGDAWLGRLEELLTRAQQIGLVLFFILCFATAVLVSNTLRLAVYARRDEIEIMKLVGATNRFIEAPFLIEGFVQGLVGASLAAAALAALYAALTPRLQAALVFSGELRRSDFLPAELTLALIGAGALLGLAASALSVGRFLRKF